MLGMMDYIIIVVFQNQRAKKASLLKNPKPLLPSAHFSTTVSNKEIENSSKWWVPVGTAKSTNWMVCWLMASPMAYAKKQACSTGSLLWGYTPEGISYWDSLDKLLCLYKWLGKPFIANNFKYNVLTVQVFLGCYLPIQLLLKIVIKCMINTHCLIVFAGHHFTSWTMRCVTFYAWTNTLL